MSKQFSGNSRGNAPGTPSGNAVSNSGNVSGGNKPVGTNHIQNSIAERKGKKQWRKGHVKPERISTRRRTRRSGGKGIFIIILMFYIGGVMALNGLEIVPWEIWLFLWRFWTVLGVFFIIWLFLGRGWVMNILISLLFLVFLGGVSFLALIYVKSPWVEGYEDKIPDIVKENFFYSGERVNDQLQIAKDEYAGVKSRRLQIDLGASNYSMQDNNRDYYLSLDAYYFDGLGEPDLTHSKDGDQLMIDFDLKSGLWLQGMGGDVPEYDFVLGGAMVPAGIHVNSTSGDGRIVLDELDLLSSTFEVGSGEMEVFLSNNEVQALAGDVGKGVLILDFNDVDIKQNLDLEVDSGRISIKIPDGYGYNINYDLGLGYIDTPGEDAKGSGKGTLVSKNYQRANKILNIKLKVKAGSFKIDY